MRHKVLITDYNWPTLDIEREILEAADASLIVAETGSADELCSLAPEVDAIMTCFKLVGSDVLKAATNCVTVARYGVGVDNIAVEQATELGMIVSNVPDYCTSEVADHTLALILSGMRRIVPFAESTKSGKWNQFELDSLHRLSSRCLGIVGFGNIGHAVAQRASAFGFEIAVFTSSRQTPASDIQGVHFCSSLDDLLRRSDIVSLHVPANLSTRGLIGRRELALMKSTAILVNTSRGSIVDEDALVDALRSRVLAGALLDVLAAETDPVSTPLAALPNVVLTPHVAYMSAESVAELERRTALNVASVLTGKLPSNIVNAAAIARRRVPR